MQFDLRHLRRIVLALPAVLAFGAVAVAGQGDAPAICRIEAVRSGNMITLTALARSDAKLSGRYSLRVSGGGRGGGANIRQGGAFQAAPGRPATLGTVSLGANGTSYDVDLELVVDGETIACSKRIGGDD